MDYQFIDFGEGRRLEKFGDFVVDRCFVEGEFDEKRKEGEWGDSGAGFFRSSGLKKIPLNPPLTRGTCKSSQDGWVKNFEDFPESWVMALDFGLRCELRLASHNQVGIFPEQHQNWLWVRERLEELKMRRPDWTSLQDRPVKILNGFGYTGLASLYAASSMDDIQVCHLDGSRPAINWGKKNVELSGISSEKIRWMEDDVLTFLRREVKRGNVYDGFILDPPAFGRGKKGTWKLSRDLPELLKLVEKLLSDDPVFVVLSCHAEDMWPRDLEKLLRKFCGKKLGKFSEKKYENFSLPITDSSGRKVDMGSCVRWG